MYISGTHFNTHKTYFLDEFEDKSRKFSDNANRELIFLVPFSNWVRPSPVLILLIVSLISKYFLEDITAEVAHKFFS